MQIKAGVSLDDLLIKLLDVYLVQQFGDRVALLIFETFQSGCLFPPEFIKLKDICIPPGSIPPVKSQNGSIKVRLWLVFCL